MPYAFSVQLQFQFQRPILIMLHKNKNIISQYSAVTELVQSESESNVWQR